MRTLHEIPRFSDRWSYLYLEYGTLDQTANGLAFQNIASSTAIPINQLSLVMLGPGTTITHAAVKALAGNSCLLAWTGQDGVKLYAHSTGATFSARRLILQAKLASDEQSRLGVVMRMYQKRFPDAGDISQKSLQEIRGMEGARVRASYQVISKQFGLQWEGRDYDQNDWKNASPANRALSSANSCLYGVVHAAIVSAGYSAGLGFIHTGKQLSFVYDIADLYKTEITVPLAFRVASTTQGNLERTVRMECRQAFYEAKLMERILPDIAEIFNADSDLGESPDELEGRAVSLATPTETGSVPREPEQTGSGGTLDKGVQESQNEGKHNDDMDIPF